MADVLGKRPHMRAQWQALTHHCIGRRMHRECMREAGQG